MRYGVDATPAQIEAARDHFFVPGYPYPPRQKRPLRDLSEREKAIVAERRSQVHQMGLDAVEFVKELHAAGMIDGWRSVGEVMVLGDGIDTSQERVDKTKGNRHGNA
jgi:hypothetical protein